MNARLLRGDFGVVLQQLAENGVRADAILLDLGVSSMQLDRPERGFSYAADAPLDMRMDPSQDDSACDVVNTWSERDLVTIFRRYGEERYAKQIARAIVRRRREQPFERTGELVDTIKAAIPAPARFGDGHPAKRVFQALRIAVNDELGSLENALPAALEMLRPGGRLAVISFHSLEDRIVKRFLRERERGCTCPPDFPVCVCGNEPELRALQRRPIRPGARRARREPAFRVGAPARSDQDGRRRPDGGRRRFAPAEVAEPHRAAAATARLPAGVRRRPYARGAGPRNAASAATSSGSSSSRVLLAGVVAVNVAVLQSNVRSRPARPASARSSRRRTQTSPRSSRRRLRRRGSRRPRAGSALSRRRPPTRRYLDLAPRGR